MMRPKEVTHMRTRWALTLLLALGIGAIPAMAGHKHRHGCGHFYSPARRGWVAIGVGSGNFGFSYSSAPRYHGYGDRYYGDPYYDGRNRGWSRYGGGGFWDPYRYDRHYDKHRGYWRGHRGHRHGYKDRCR
jgi:hypothetical protein